MKKSKILVLSLFVIIIASCSKSNWERGEVCTSVDQSTIQQGETINVSSCGDTPPAQYVTTELDWGDGTKTDGLTGNHKYEKAGTFYIKVLMNGDYAADVTEVEDAKVKHKITVQ